MGNTNYDPYRVMLSFLHILTDNYYVTHIIILEMSCYKLAISFKNLYNLSVS